MKHIVTIEDLNNKDIIDILDRAKKLVPIAEGRKTSNSLSGKIVATCFFEPSTRTRLSFETAILRLGGNYIGFADPSATSHIKGETLADSIRMVSGYADAVVLRHPQEGSARLAADLSSVPIINAGDGAGQHPTQTLLDLFTIREEVGQLEGLNVGLLGDLRYGRTASSLAYGLSMFNDVDASNEMVVPSTASVPSISVLSKLAMTFY